MSGHEAERLSAYLDGELEPGSRAAVKDHLRECAACAEHLARLAAVDAAARAQPLEEPPGYFDTFAGRVRARIERAAPATRRPRGEAHAARWRLPPWAWAAAAALVLAVVTPLTVRQIRAP